MEKNRPMVLFYSIGWELSGRRSDFDRMIGRAQFAVYGSPAAVKTSQSGGVGTVPAIGPMQEGPIYEIPATNSI